MTTMTEAYRELFLRAYRAALLWQATDENGAPLDREWTVDDFSADAERQMEADCEDFVSSNFVELLSAGDAEQNGHDFALTRNGHGAGFWDRGYGLIGENLTQACKPYGAQDVYVSDENTLEVA